MRSLFNGLCNWFMSRNRGLTWIFLSFSQAEGSMYHTLFSFIEIHSGGGDRSTMNLLRIPRSKFLLFTCGRFDV